MLPHVRGGFDDIGKFDLRRGIEIEHQPPRHVRRKRRAIPRMQLERTDLCDRRKPFDAIDLQIGFVVAENLHQLQKVRGAFHGVALKEALAVDAVRRADQRAWPSLDMTDRPFADRLEIAREIEFGHRLAVTRVRPHHLVGM